MPVNWARLNRHALRFFPTPLRGDVIQLTGLVQRVRPQVLHGWQDRSSLACGWVGLQQGIDRIVLSARNMQPAKRGLMQRYAASMLRSYAAAPNVALTANAEVCARDYEAWLQLPSDTFRPLRNGVRPAQVDSVAPRNEPSKGVTIGGVFRLAANKRPSLWLRTVAELQKIYPEPIRARLVGRGPFRQEIVDLAEELGFEEIELVEGLSSPREIYAGMDAVLLMSRVEGLPNVVLEAQAEGLPVAACDVGGVTEALCPTRPGAGLLLPSDPTEKEAAGLLRGWLPLALAGGKEARREFVEGRFGMAALSKQITQIYLGTCSAR